MTLSFTLNSEINPRDYQKGFTLIEILIVLVILGLGVSLVGPRMFATYEKVQSSVEEQKLTLILESVSMKAFLRRTPFTIEFHDNILQIKGQHARINFKLICFPRESITYNRNGFSNTEKITYVVRGINKVVNVSK